MFRIWKKESRILRELQRPLEKDGRGCSGLCARRADHANAEMAGAGTRNQKPKESDIRNSQIDRFAAEERRIVGSDVHSAIGKLEQPPKLAREQTNLSIHYRPTSSHPQTTAHRLQTTEERAWTAKARGNTRREQTNKARKEKLNDLIRFFCHASLSLFCGYSLLDATRALSNALFSFFFSFHQRSSCRR